MGKKLWAAKVSIGVNIALLASKIIIAFLTGSVGLLAESAHSGFDLLASLFAYAGIRKAQEPSDRTHMFGHEKFETLSSAVQTMLIAATALIVIFEAYEKLIAPTKLESSELGIALMLISIPVTYLTSRLLGDVAKKEGSSALEADAAHFTTDIMSSVAVLIGLILAKFGFVAGDPIAAIVVAFIMLYISFELGTKAFKVFMDFSPDAETMAKLEQVLIDEKKITRFHKLRARMSGSRIFVEVHVQFPHNTHVNRAHAITHKIKDAMIKSVPEVKDVSIHIEPD